MSECVRQCVTEQPSRIAESRINPWKCKKIKAIVIKVIGKTRSNRSHINPFLLLKNTPGARFGLKFTY